MCAKFHCPSLTVTLFPERVGWNPLVIKSQKAKKPGLNRVKVKYLSKNSINQYGSNTFVDRSLSSFYQLLPISSANK